MSATDRSLRYITGRNFGKVAVTLTGAATVLTGAAIMAPGASAATACVNQTIGQNNTYQSCVVDEQVLLNNLYNVHVPGPNQRLTVDGYYGPHTASDVAAFMYYWELDPDPTTTTFTWETLCQVDYQYGFHGVYWHGAGCTEFPP